jgi:hypothetical protein
VKRLRARSARCAAAALLVAASVATLGAQATTAPAARTGPTYIIAVNPFLPLAGQFQGEFEARTRDNLSVAASVAHVELWDTFTSTDLKLRFYPQERALNGFAFSAGAGYGRVRGDSDFCDLRPGTPPNEFPECVYGNVSRSGPTFSVEMQYQWLLGTRRSTAISIGGGAKRYYLGSDKAGLQDYQPTVRLTIGYGW